MLTTSYVPAAAECRRAVVPTCDPVVEHTGTTPPSVDGQIMKIKAGDTIDVGIDWKAFFEANNVDASNVTVLFAAHALSPQAPVFSGSLTLYDKDKAQAVVLLDASAAVVGNIYYITCTATLPGVTNSGLTIPTRTVRRTIHVRVVL